MVPLAMNEKGLFHKSNKYICIQKVFSTVCQSYSGKVKHVLFCNLKKDLRLNQFVPEGYFDFLWAVGVACFNANEVQMCLFYVVFKV